MGKGEEGEDIVHLSPSPPPSPPRNFNTIEAMKIKFGWYIEYPKKFAEMFTTLSGMNYVWFFSGSAT